MKDETADAMDGQPVGSIDLTRLSWEWDVIDRQSGLVDDADRLARSHNLLTPRRIDEAQPCGIDTYIAARGLIGAALDNGRSLMYLLTSKGATAWAPWVLLRATFEASAWAVWLLEPDSGLERRRRGLRRVCEDNRQWKSWAEVFASVDKQTCQEFQERLATIQADRKQDASDLGWSWQQATTKPVLADELPKLRTLQATGEAKNAANLWRSLSGMDHSLSYAMMANTVARHTRPVPGGEHHIRSMDGLAWSVHAGATSLLVLEAIQIYHRRASLPASAS